VYRDSGSRGCWGRRGSWRGALFRVRRGRGSSALTQAFRVPAVSCRLRSIRCSGAIVPKLFPSLGQSFSRSSCWCCRLHRARTVAWVSFPEASFAFSVTTRRSGANPLGQRRSPSAHRSHSPMRFQLAKVRIMSTTVEVPVWVTDYVERDGDLRWAQSCGSASHVVVSRSARSPRQSVASGSCIGAWRQVVQPDLNARTSSIPRRRFRPSW
jgi:hypothetical protein